MPLSDEHALEQLLRQITAARVRGDWATARQLAEEATQKAPQRADVHELLGDILRQLGDKEGALSCYQRARDLEPQRRSAEEKFAATLLELRTFEVPDEETPALPKNPMLALALSAVLPGVGQIYNEQWLKGILFCLGTLLPLGSFLQLYGKTVTHSLNAPIPSASEPSLGQLLLTALVGLIALAMWTWSLWDAYQTARRFQRRSLPPQEGLTSS
jgi:tetratricopeptide (TPR) repeat protein